MGTVEEQPEQTGSWDLGLERYHIWFALSFWLGTAILPPSGATTIAGWIGGAIGSLVTTLVIFGVGLFAIRSLDDWRPPTDPELARPETSLRTLLFAFLCVQLFLFGTQVVVDLGIQAIVMVLAPLNVIVSALVLGDMFLLGKQGIEWDSLDYGYAAVALIVGFVGGLGYWFQRGRKRTAWAQAQQDSEEAEDAQQASAEAQAQQDDDEATTAATQPESAIDEREPDTDEGADEDAGTEPTEESSEDNTGADDTEESTAADGESEHESNESDEK